MINIISFVSLQQIKSFNNSKILKKNYNSNDYKFKYTQNPNQSINLIKT